MIRDELTTFAKATALNTGDAGSYIIGNVIDTEDVRDLGAGTQDLHFYAVVNTTATSGGSATLVLNLVTDDNSSLSSPTVIASSGTAKAVANLGAGKVIVDVRLPQNAAYERYLGIQQVTGTAAFTAGKIDAFLSLETPAHNSYPDALEPIA